MFWCCGDRFRAVENMVNWVPPKKPVESKDFLKEVILRIIMVWKRVPPNLNNAAVAPWALELRNGPRTCTPLNTLEHPATPSNTQKHSSNTQ